MEARHQERYEQYVQMTEAYLQKCFDMSDLPPHLKQHEGLAEVMRYSLLSGGKRVRAALLLEFCHLCEGDLEQALPMAAAVEMLHTYSLIHDDLPCMDNDDLRRGKPACHVAYGEANALLAGDALQAAAFQEIFKAEIPDDALVRCAHILADAAGPEGICAGQYLDLQPAPETDSFDIRDKWLYNIDKRKTSSLISAACAMGASVAGAPLEYVGMAQAFGQMLGLAFQIRDDMLDVMGTEEELGKPIGSDEERGKLTYMSLYGEKGCFGLLENYCSQAVAILWGLFDEEKSAFLVDFIWDLYDRMK